MLVRTTPIDRSVTSAQGVLTGLAPGINPGESTAVIRLNRGPQWMVYNNFQCKKLSAFFRSSAASKASAEEASAVMDEVATRTGISLTAPVDGEGKGKVDEGGMKGGVDAAVSWQAKASPAEVLMRYRDAMACRIAHGRPFPVGLDADLFRKVNAAATRAICGAFQGGVDAPPETRKLALGLATGRFLHHILDGACPSRKRCFSCFCLEHVLTRR